MRRPERAALRILLFVFGALLFAAAPASAHDCSSQADCEQTTGYVGGIATVGGIIAILTGVLGGQLGGGIGGAVGGAVGGATTPAPGGPTQREDEEPESEPSTEAVDDEEVEVPWGELIEATEPPAQTAPGDETAPVEEAEPATPTDTSEQPPTESATEDELEIPWDELIEATEPGQETHVDAPEAGEEARVDAPADAPEDAGDPGIDELVPTEPDEEAPEEEEPASGPIKPPILETTEAVQDAAERTKDAAERVGDWAEDVGDGVDKAREVLDGLGGSVSDETREKAEETLDWIEERAGNAGKVTKKTAEVAGEVAELAEKAADYMNDLNDSLERAEKMGLSDESSEAVGWWRMTWKGAGEAMGKFRDAVTKPIEKIFGESASEKVKEFVPVEEFGDEMGEALTSAAEHVTNAQRRDQVSQVMAYPKDDPGYIELDDLYPGRKWP